jgi:hypothetical protein
MRRKVFIAAVLILVIVLAALPGCGSKTASSSDTSGKPEAVTGFEAMQYTKPVASKWQGDNWVIMMRSGDSEGMTREGKAKIWEVYYFSPTPEQDSQEMIIYNRGNIWPMAPGVAKGGDQGQTAYKKDKPPDLRVDSGEAYTVAQRNGGGDFIDQHADAKVEAVLRCKADYAAVSQDMPAPKYQWIWAINYRTPTLQGPMLEVDIDGMNGDFITKNTGQNQ